MRLRDRDVAFHDTFGSTHMNSLGYFMVSGTAGDLFGNPDPFIEVEYEYSRVHMDEWKYSRSSLELTDEKILQQEAIQVTSTLVISHSVAITAELML